MLGLVHDVVARGLDVLGGGEHVVRHVLAALKAAHGTREVLVGAGGLGAGTRDDERGTRLVDQDGVDLVDDGVVVAALHALLALVKRNPVRVEEFRSIRGTDQLGERDVDGALMAIKRGASCPHDRLPLMVRGHRQISPELESVTDLMYALIRLVAERSGVATSVIASRDDLADYIEHPEQSPLREGWRFELVGSRLDDLLSGNMGLTVKDGKIELL